MRLSPYAVTAALTLAFALADRWCGGGLFWGRLAHDHGGPLRGRPAYYSTLPLLGCCYALAGWPVALLALAWAIYRSAFGFPDDTITGRDQVATLEHHLIIGAFAVLWVLVMDFPARCGLPFLAYVGAAVALAKWNGDSALDSEHPRDANGFVEALRGAAFGFATGIALSIK